ncbi:MAG: hypothetical protein V4561_09645 [Bacteroidota bacterium]
MPVNNLIGTQLDLGQLQSCLNQLTIVRDILLNYSENLTPEERQRYGSINEQNKLLVSKVMDYNRTEPSLSSPDVNWANFEQSWASRVGFAQLETMCHTIIEICSDPRILHDYYLYQNALVDYDYSKYKANSTQGGAGFSTKVEDIKQLFPNPSGHNSTPAGE